jgi:hypothetical protein
MIVAACEEIVNIYDAVTFVLRQSLNTPETVTKIQGSPNGSTLFFAHSHLCDYVGRADRRTHPYLRHAIRDH